MFQTPSKSVNALRIAVEKFFELYILPIKESSCVWSWRLALTSDRMYESLEMYHGPLTTFFKNKALSVHANDIPAPKPNEVSSAFIFQITYIRCNLYP